MLVLNLVSTVGSRYEKIILLVLLVSPYTLANPRLN